MRKRVLGKQLNRDRGARGALIRSQMRALVLNEKIVTTRAKAKVLISEAERVMSKVRDGSQSARRDVMARMANDKEVVKKLFGELAILTKARTSGFIRIVNLPNRKGDDAKMVRVELVK